MATYPKSAQAALDHLQSTFPYSSFTLGTWIGKDGSKLLVVKKKGISVCRIGYKHIYLNSKTSSIHGSNSSSLPPSCDGDGDVLVDKDGVTPSTARPSMARYETAREPGGGEGGGEDFRRLSADLASSLRTSTGIDINPSNLPIAALGAVLAVMFGLKVSPGICMPSRGSQNHHRTCKVLCPL